MVINIHCASIFRMKNTWPELTLYSQSIFSLNCYSVVEFSLRKRRARGLRARNWETYLVDFPSGDDVWVKSTHSFATATEDFVARAAMLVAVSCTAGLCSHCKAIRNSEGSQLSDSLYSSDDNNYHCNNYYLRQQRTKKTSEERKHKTPIPSLARSTTYTAAYGRSRVP